MKELNAILDENMPPRPRWNHEELDIEGEKVEYHYRDVLECINVLYSDPQFARYLVFRPERHFADAAQTTQLFHEMHTSNWWWTIQVWEVVLNHYTMLKCLLDCIGERKTRCNYYSSNNCIRQDSSYTFSQ